MSDANYDEAMELAAIAGITLSADQQRSLRDGMRMTAARWDTFRVYIPHSDPDVLLVRELTGIFLLNECIVHMAFNYNTTSAAFQRIKSAIECSVLQKLVKRISQVHGAENVELFSEGRIHFDVKQSLGHGFSCDCLIIEDANKFSDKDFCALLPTLSARPNPQIWCTVT